MDMPDIELSDDLTEEELTELEIYLDPAEYNVPAMVDAAFEDLYQLVKFLERIADVSLVGDDKYGRLLELLNGPRTGRKKTEAPLDPTVFTPAFTTDKVLVFTEFADTARYLERATARGRRHPRRPPRRHPQGRPATDDPTLRPLLQQGRPPRSARISTPCASSCRPTCSARA